MTSRLRSPWIKIILVTGTLTACETPVVQARGNGAALEAQARAADYAHAQAVLRGDQAALNQLWNDEFIINNQFHQVDHGERIKKGIVTYAYFVREVEAAKVYGDTVILMGHETVMPKGASPDAGKTWHRRYTNVWTKLQGKWRLVARHAHVVPE
ncbi:MAG TPA: nuclear transport factor 2 family protein [Polyangia bacterium]